jgi:hypothetical protein
MTPNEMMTLLLSFEKRLATIADQAHETREQAQHTLDRINRLRRDLDLLKQTLVAAMETVQFEPEPETPAPPLKENPVEGDPVRR